MERIYTLIDKLYQQKTAQAPPSHLLFTIQLLQQELALLQSKEGAQGTKRVSVMLPGHHNYTADSLRIPFNESNLEKEIFVLEEVAGVPADESETQLEFLPELQQYASLKPVSPSVVYRMDDNKKSSPSIMASHQLYNGDSISTTEAPTLTQYGQGREVHHGLADNRESLNDRLKGDTTELAHRLKETPVKDLRKAIGINDRFTFVKELFRGDESAYERSIKTINGFHIYSEAEYWIARELKLKFAWADDSEPAKHFYQLIRRRFS